MAYYTPKVHSHPLVRENFPLNILKMFSSKLGLRSAMLIVYECPYCPKKIYFICIVINLLKRLKRSLLIWTFS